MSNDVNTGVSTNMVPKPSVAPIYGGAQLQPGAPMPPANPAPGATSPSALSGLMQQLGGSGGSTTPALNSFLNQYLPGAGVGDGAIAPTGMGQDMAYLNALFGGQAAPGVLGSLLGSFGGAPAVAAGPMADGTAGYATTTAGSGALGAIGDGASSAGSALMGLFA